MTLELDERQRAMLQEMGVPVWLPRAVAEVVAAPTAPVPATARPAARQAAPVPADGDAATVGTGTGTGTGTGNGNGNGNGDSDSDSDSDSASAAPAGRPNDNAPAARPPAASVAGAATREPSITAGTVVLGDWRQLYPEPAAGDAAPVWLVLAESPAGGLLDGDAGRLLDNMLRAARLHRNARVWASIVSRAPESDGADANGDHVPLAAGLQAAVALHRPAMVLAMGRLAAQAALGSGEPLGKLRGQVHDTAGTRLVATYDAPFLLRAQADKARAWEDLCRALASVPPVPVPAEAVAPALPATPDA